jgi:hypothetical protein
MVNRCIFLIVTAFLFVLSACGGGNSGHEAPAEATLTINPSDYTVTVGENFPLTTYTQHFLIVVKNEKGIPLRNVNLKISYPWAQPNDTVVQLYDGGTPKNSPMTVETDENGTYDLRFDYVVGNNGLNDLEYKGDLVVTSGTLFESATFEVTVETAT